MEIQLELHSILRDRLPPEAEGKAVLELKDQATIADLLDELNINRRVVVSVNNVHETNHSRQLNAGDKVMLFSSISGG